MSEKHPAAKRLRLGGDEEEEAGTSGGQQSEFRAPAPLRRRRTDPRRAAAATAATNTNTQSDSESDGERDLFGGGGGAMDEDDFFPLSQTDNPPPPRSRSRSRSRSRLGSEQQSASNSLELDDSDRYPSVGAAARVSSAASSSAPAAAAAAAGSGADSGPRAHSPPALSPAPAAVPAKATPRTPAAAAAANPGSNGCPDTPLLANTPLGSGVATAGDEDGGEDDDARPQRRSLHDRIYHQVLVEPLLVAIIDTPQFQRLRSLKQLGGSDYVYPSACHSRFEHCIGVSHLAGIMLRHLQRQQPELEIDEVDYLCVRMAGLCHDLGHGPFSHMFEMFVNRIRSSEGKTPWHHEEASVALLDLLLAANDIRLEQDFGLRPCDLCFVKRLIRGLDSSEPWPGEEIGRPPAKRFLFDVVANQRNGLDVDKFDYFVRDATAALGYPPISCDVSRIIHSSRVIEVEGQTQICFEEKMALGLFEVFRLRAWLHKYIYQHHTVNLIEEMICDVLMAANDHFFVRGANDDPIRISDAVCDMTAFSKLGDWVLAAIEASCEPELIPAQEILARIRRRDLYAQVIGPIQVPPLDRAHTQELVGSEEHVKAEILALADADSPAQRQHLTDDLLVHFVSITYGYRNPEGLADNPLIRVRFFNPKADWNHAYTIQHRRMPHLFSPRAFEEKLIYVYTRHMRSFDQLERAYSSWRAKLQRRIAVIGKRRGSSAAGGGSASGGLDSPGLGGALTPVSTSNPASPNRRKLGQVARVKELDAASRLARPAK